MLDVDELPFQQDVVLPQHDLWDGRCMYIGMICGMDGACI